jgi:hypothetical protein
VYCCKHFRTCTWCVSCPVVEANLYLSVERHNAVSDRIDRRTQQLRQTSVRWCYPQISATPPTSTVCMVELTFVVSTMHTFFFAVYERISGLRFEPIISETQIRSTVVLEPGFVYAKSSLLWVRKMLWTVGRLQEIKVATHRSFCILYIVLTGQLIWSVKHMAQVSSSAVCVESLYCDHPKRQTCFSWHSSPSFIAPEATRTDMGSRKEGACL